MKPTPEPIPRRLPPDVQRSHAEDLAFVRQILDGDQTAWTAFVERYAGLILAMARRYLRSHDPDDVRTVFVNVLDSLWRTRLRTYQGRASLATWLTLVARSEVMDHLRRKFGRDLKLKALERLSPAERTVFRLYYIEGWSRDEVATRMEAEGERRSEDRFHAALRQIEIKLGDRWLKRLAYDLHAQSVGAVSGRMLEYLDHVRDEFEQRAGAFSPEYHLMEQEAQRTVDHLRVAMSTLPPNERRLLELRFEQGWTARRIASELGLSGQRSVYTAIERLVNTLRRKLAGDSET